MRKIDEKRAENYIKRHIRHKKWIAFALCVSLLTGSGTLYMLNKPATAMTEDGAKTVGLVLDTADTEFEQGLIQQMEEAEAAKEEATSESDDAALESSNSDAEETADSESSQDEKDQSEDKESSEADKEESDGKETSDDKEKSAEEEESSETKVVKKVIRTVSTKADKSKSVEQKSDVVITVRYEDKDGEEIAEAKELSISESFDLKEEVRSFEGYLFTKGFIGDEEVTSLVKKSSSEMPDYEALKAAAQDEAKELSDETQVIEKVVYIDPETKEEVKIDEDDKDIKVIEEVIEETREESKEDTKEDTKSEYTYYEATLASGDILVVDEDADLRLVYMKQNEKEEFEFASDEYNVKVKLSNPSALPGGVELKVTTIDKDAEGYSYDAYLDALNENSKSIADENEADEDQTFDESNTLILDIAFILDGIEYQPSEGSVSVDVELADNKLSDSFGATTASEVGVIHLPVNEEIMETLDATSEATDIAASDINVEIVKGTNVELSGNTDSVSFETESFSAYAFVYLNGKAISWNGTDEMTAKQIAQSLGDNTMFGAVAGTFESLDNSDVEANIAVGTLKSAPAYFGNSAEVYTHVSFNGYYVTKTSTKDGTYYFGLFSEKYSDTKKNPNNIGYFEITVKDGTGTVNLSKVFDNKKLGQYARLYVYEMDGPSNQKKKPQIVADNQTFNLDGVNYTVSYDNNDLATESDNDIVGSFSSSYIESNETGLTGSALGNKLHSVKGNTVYVKNADNSYTVHSFPNNIEGTQVSGTFPISVSDLLDTAKAASVKIAKLKNYEDVMVINAIGTSDGFRKDVAKSYFNTFDENMLNNGLTAEWGGINIGNKLLVINLDLTNCNEYKIEQFRVIAKEAKITGQGWDEIANQIIINPVVRNGNGDYVPYTGKLILDTVSGTILAPSATVDVNNGAEPGSVIGDHVIQRKEIHKLTIRKYLDKQAELDIRNVAEGSDKYIIQVDKYINDVLATDQDNGKFSFILAMLKVDESGNKYWNPVEWDIKNVGSSISKEIYPSAYGMRFGDGKDPNEQSYYFVLFENSVADGYNKDETAILIKIKYYKGGETEPLYYRLTASEASDLQSHPSNISSYANDAHRIGKAANKDKGKLYQNKAFYNTTVETVDVEVTKDWILNGKELSDIPTDTSKVVLTLYQTVAGVTTAVDTTKYPCAVTKVNERTDSAKADATWKFNWSKLPKYDASRNLITYTVVETTVPDGFKSDATADAPKTIVFGTQEYKNTTTGSTSLGTATVTNKGVSLKLKLYKYLDNVPTSESFDFRIKIREYNKGKNDTQGRDKWISHDDAHLVNDDKGVISYTIDPSRYNMKPSDKYYVLRIDEYSLNDDEHYKNKTYSRADYPNIVRDKGIILVKVDYKSANDIDIHYYRVDDEKDVKAIADDCTKADAYLTSEYEVTDDKVAFYNSTSGNITITVTKEWDELVGMAKNNKLTSDNIFDVTFKLLRSEDGSNWETAEEYTIKAPRYYQDDAGDNFTLVEKGDYPDNWTFKSNTIAINNLSSKYQYKIQEWYGDQMLGEAQSTTTLNGEVVNGFKLSKVIVETDQVGNIDYTLHNTPYLQVYKYWQFNGADVSYEDTAGYSPVYVKIFRYYRNDTNRKQMDYNELKNATPEQYKQYILQDPTNPGKAMVQLCYANHWYCEFAVERKQDNAPNDSHVYQYVYQMRECSSEGVDRDASPYILYGGQSLNNVTRSTADYNYRRGFDGDNITGQMDWTAAVAKGNNHPINVLTVTNILGTAVLPNSGGEGTSQYIAFGILLMAIAFSGYMLFKKREQL